MISHTASSVSLLIRNNIKSTTHNNNVQYEGGKIYTIDILLFTHNIIYYNAHNSHDFWLLCDITPHSGNINNNDNEGIRKSIHGTVRNIVVYINYNIFWPFDNSQFSDRILYIFGTRENGPKSLFLSDQSNYQKFKTLNEIVWYITVVFRIGSLHNNG